MSLHGFAALRPHVLELDTAERLERKRVVFHYDDLDGDPDDITIRRLRERWHSIEWVSREDDRVHNGQRIYPEGSGVLMYDAYLDWILNGQDNLTFQEWQDADRPMAIHARHVGGSQSRGPLGLD
jgi:hypothetical protein